MESALGLDSGYCSRYFLRNSAWVEFEKVSMLMPGSISLSCLETVTPLSILRMPSEPTKRKPDVSPAPLTKLTRNARLKAGIFEVSG